MWKEREQFWKRLTERKLCGYLPTYGNKQRRFAFRWGPGSDACSSESTAYSKLSLVHTWMDGWVGEWVGR